MHLFPFQLMLIYTWRHPLNYESINVSNHKFIFFIFILYRLINIFERRLWNFYENFRVSVKDYDGNSLVGNFITFIMVEWERINYSFLMFGLSWRFISIDLTIKLLSENEILILTFLTNKSLVKTLILMRKIEISSIKITKEL